MEINGVTSKIYFLFLFLIPIILLVGVFKCGEFFYLNLGDIYFVMEYFDVVIIISVLFFFIALIYFTLDKFRFVNNSWLKYFHLGFTVFFTLFFLLSTHLIFNVQPEESSIAEINVEFKSILKVGNIFFYWELLHLKFY